MTHEEFRIGMEFWCGGRRWRCTDVGTRTVVAVCLERHDVVTITGDVAAGDTTTTPTTTTDDSWFAGPPSAVPEEVFDEHSIQDCSLSRDAGDG